jgi:5-methylcytosine-specific restriction endonuclease McrA
LKRSALKPNPEKVREWQQRSRTPLKRETRLAPGKRKQRAKVPQTIRDKVRRRSSGACVVCLFDARQRGDTRRVAQMLFTGHVARIEDLHHALPVRDYPQLELEPDNLVGVCRAHHDLHERAHRRIPWAALPECAITLAYSTSGAAAVFLERTYPR